MKERICGFLGDVLEGVGNDGFVCGYVTGFALLLVLALALFLLYCLKLRSRRVSSILIPMRRGALEISAGAVADLIKRLEPQFRGIEICRVGLFRRRGAVRLEIVLNFLSETESMPEIAAEIQQKVFEALKNSFGIETVESVLIRVKRAPAALSSF